METKTDALCTMARQLRLTSLGNHLDDLVSQAEQNQISYLDFALGLLQIEIDYRNRKNLEKRLKTG